MRLYQESYVDRICEYQTIKDEVSKPLTKKQKERLKATCWNACKKAYVSRMTSSGLVSSLDTNGDLVSEAYIFMCSVLERFDLAECGEISDVDVRGKKNPKTLEFYFKTYLQRTVNFLACDARLGMKQRGQVVGDGFGQLGTVTKEPNSKEGLVKAKKLLLAKLYELPAEVTCSFERLFLMKTKKGESNRLLTYAESHREGINSIIEEVEDETGVPFSELRSYLRSKKEPSDPLTKSLKPNKVPFRAQDDSFVWSIAKLKDEFIPTLTEVQKTVFVNRYIDGEGPKAAGIRRSLYTKTLRQLKVLFEEYAKKGSVALRSPKKDTQPRRAPKAKKKRAKMKKQVRSDRRPQSKPLKKTKSHLVYKLIEADAIRYGSLNEWKKNSYVNYKFAGRAGWHGMLATKIAEKKQP